MKLIIGIVTLSVLAFAAGSVSAAAATAPTRKISVEARLADVSMKFQFEQKGAAITGRFESSNDAPFEVAMKPEDFEFLYKSARALPVTQRMPASCGRRWIAVEALPSDGKKRKVCLVAGGAQQKDYARFASTLRWFWLLNKNSGD